MINVNKDNEIIGFVVGCDKFPIFDEETHTCSTQAQLVLVLAQTVSDALVVAFQECPDQSSDLIFTYEMATYAVEPETLYSMSLTGLKHVSQGQDSPTRTLNQDAVIALWGKVMSFVMSAGPNGQPKRAGIRRCQYFPLASIYSGKPRPVAFVTRVGNRLFVMKITSKIDVNDKKKFIRLVQDCACGSGDPCTTCNRKQCEEHPCYCAEQDVIRVSGMPQPISFINVLRAWAVDPLCKEIKSCWNGEDSTLILPARNLEPHFHLAAGRTMEQIRELIFAKLSAVVRRPDPEPQITNFVKREMFHILPQGWKTKPLPENVDILEFIDAHCHESPRKEVATPTPKYNVLPAKRDTKIREDTFDIIDALCTDQEQESSIVNSTDTPSKAESRAIQETTQDAAKFSDVGDMPDEDTSDVEEWLMVHNGKTERPLREYLTTKYHCKPGFDERAILNVTPCAPACEGKQLKLVPPAHKHMRTLSCSIEDFVQFLRRGTVVPCVGYCCPNCTPKSKKRRVERL